MNNGQNMIINNQVSQANQNVQYQIQKVKPYMIYFLCTITNKQKIHYKSKETKHEVWMINEKNQSSKSFITIF